MRGLRPLTNGRRWRGGADFSGLPRCGSGRRSLLGPPRRAASPASPSRVRPAACAGLSGRSRRPPPHRGSHGVLGSAGGTDGFYFQPPFLAGLSGYIAEIGAAMLCAQLGMKPTEREDHAAYIADWLKALRGDKRAIFRAAAAAQAASELILSHMTDEPARQAA
nr:zincin-like metallopeptidase domain-containing protein [Tardibacter chloracetimidivorans]